MPFRTDPHLERTEKDFVNLPSGMNIWVPCSCLRRIAERARPTKTLAISWREGVSCAEILFSMLKIRPLDSTLRFSAKFPEPKHFDISIMRKVGDAILKDFSPGGAKTTDIVLDNGDGLYRYSLTVSLFSDVVSFSLNANEWEVTFGSIKSVVERDLTDQFLKMFVTIMSPLSPLEGDLRMGVHLSCDSVKTRNDFLSRAAKPEKGIPVVGTVGYKTDRSECSWVRISIDQSYGFPDGLFVEWWASLIKIEYVLSKVLHWREFFNMLEPFELEVVLDEIRN